MNELLLQHHQIYLSRFTGFTSFGPLSREMDEFREEGDNTCAQHDI